ncbi:MAG TPA: hypothetical protein VMA35_13075 [Candidatus Sulfopaludibacter sp.]|nr:hypothetical protein [Candidatus Sulfopaludibacter sp.]
MRSHFVVPRGVTAACAVAGATAVLNGNCSAGTFIAADYATNATYLSGWTTNQNSGYGFSAWSFDGTSTNSSQAMSSSSSIGTAWTLLDGSSVGGISIAGRAITEPGGLQPGQTFQTVIQNPTGYHFYRGFDILFCNGTDTNPGGDNAAALRLTVFGYYGGYGATFWSVTDGSPYGSTTTPLDFTNTAAGGMQIALTLTSATNYSLTMTPLNGTTPYTLTGSLALTNTDADTSLIVTNLPINYVNYRLWNTASSGPNDTTNNFFISSMTILGLTLNIQVVGNNAILSWPTNFPAFYLASSTNLGPVAVWNTNLPSPAIVNGQNVVTNPITGSQQFFRLQ